MLYILGGLPGVGKSSLGRELARRAGAVYLRIDTIEWALAEAGHTAADDPSGYLVGYAVAKDNIDLGVRVVADSVNPLEITRSAWRRAAANAGMGSAEIEVICSDASEHRRRVEAAVCQSTRDAPLSRSPPGPRAGPSAPIHGLVPAGRRGKARRSPERPRLRRRPRRCQRVPQPPHRVGQTSRASVN